MAWGVAPRKLIVPKDGNKPRIETFLVSAVPGITEQRVRRLLAESRIRLRGKPLKLGRVLWGGEELELELPPPNPVPRQEGPIIPVLHQDAELMIANKPSGLVVEPSDGTPSLVRLMASQHTGWDVEGEALPGVVHRLDRETSGCLMLARTDDAVVMLKQAFEEKRIAKRYLALVLGAPPDEARLETPYARNPQNSRLYTSRVPSPRKAILAFRVKQRFGDRTLLEVDLETGRTHQIRVQLADAGYPVLGDPLYGPVETRTHPAAVALGRLGLHAAALTLSLTDRQIVAEAPLPPDFAAACQ